MTDREPGISALLDRESWHDERLQLHTILLDCGLGVQVKWAKLCYTHENNNVAIIQSTSRYCALGFFKGALLEEHDGTLVSPGKHSQAMRQLRFDNLSDIARSESLIRRLVEQAIRLEKDGRKIEFSEKENLVYPPELQNALDGDSDLAKAFNALTPGRRRGYVLHITEAKQSGTRLSRIAKCTPRILSGQGFNER